jgi:hypothetical protein
MDAKDQEVRQLQAAFSRQEDQAALLLRSRAQESVGGEGLDGREVAMVEV